MLELIPFWTTGHKINEIYISEYGIQCGISTSPWSKSQCASFSPEPRFSPQTRGALLGLSIRIENSGSEFVSVWIMCVC